MDRSDACTRESLIEVSKFIKTVKYSQKLRGSLTLEISWVFI
jgi:hypothetical protein